jgi:hypothetical protein
MTKSRSSMIFAGMTICTLAFYLLASSYLSPNPSPETTSSEKTSTITTSVRTTTGSSTEVLTNQTSGSNFAGTLLTGAAIYSRLGYPILTYNNNTHYSPSKPNFTLEYRSNPAFTVGYLEMPVINVTQAVRLAENYAGLSKVNYSLVDADLEPGTFVNNTMKTSAVWNLGFARVEDGYWRLGSLDVNGATNLVSLDAVSGSILRASSSPGSGPAPGDYRLGVDASQAFASVRGLKLLNLPDGFAQTANVTSITPRIVKLGLSPHTFFLYAPANGQDRLCWKVLLSYQPFDYDLLHAVFYVDGLNGQLLAASAEGAYRPNHRGIANTSFVSSSAQNLTVSQEAFQMNTSAPASRIRSP